MANPGPIGDSSVPLFSFLNVVEAGDTLTN